MNIYDHIDANNRKTVLLLLLFPLILCLMVIIAMVIAFHVIADTQFAYDYLYPYAHVIQKLNIKITETNIYFWTAIAYVLNILPWVFGGGLLWMLISWNFGDKMILWGAKAQPLELKDNPQIYRLVENVAIAAGLPRPNLYIINDNSLNAFATGRDPKHASVTRTTGIISRLEPLELEGVIAHEIAHIGNRDIRLNMLIITGLSVFGFLADALRIRMRYLNNNKDSSKLFIVYLSIFIALILFNSLIAPLIQLAISRSREYAADATGALITRNPKALAAALQKISEDARVEILDIQKNISTACIADPRDIKLAFSSAFSTHPPIENRIKRLLQMNGE